MKYMTVLERIQQLMLGSSEVGMNYYCTSEREILKPCEMSVQKVIHFSENYRFDSKI